MEAVNKHVRANAALTSASIPQERAVEASQLAGPFSLRPPFSPSLHASLYRRWPLPHFPSLSPSPDPAPAHSPLSAPKQEASRALAKSAAAMLRALRRQASATNASSGARLASAYGSAFERTAAAATLLHTRLMHQQTTWRADATAPTHSAAASGRTVHLVKLLARAGVASRRDALRLVQSGRVLVDGTALTAAGASYLIPQTARVTIDGKPFLDPLAAAAQAAEQATKKQGENEEAAVSASLDDAAGASASTGSSQSSSSAPATAPFTPVRVPTHLPRPRLWLYYKPVGLLCSHKDEARQRRTMFQQIHEDYFAAKDALLRNDASSSSPASTMQDETIDRLLSVGRLDYLSEGLMLLTNSGAIQGFLEHPSTGFERTYRIKIPSALTEEQEMALNRGVNIEGFQYKPVQIVRLTSPSAAVASSKRSTGVWYELQLREGKNRELRNLLNHFGHPILKLIRVGFHNWKIDVNFMRQAAAEAAEAAKLSPSSPRAIAASMPLASRPPVEIMQRLTDGSGRKKDTVVSLVPGQLVEIEWPSHLEQQRKAWLARKNEAREHAAAVAALAPSPASSSTSASAHSSFSRPMHSGSALSSSLGSPLSWTAWSSSQSVAGSMPLRSFSTQHTPFSLTNPASAFLSRKKGQHEGHDQAPTAGAAKPSSASPNVSGSAPSAASSAAATVTEEIPTHIHSMTCGCANENTIPNDDQRILPDEFEGGSEAFLAGLDQSISGQDTEDEAARSESKSQCMVLIARRLRVFVLIRSCSCFLCSSPQLRARFSRAGGFLRFCPRGSGIRCCFSHRLQFESLGEMESSQFAASQSSVGATQKLRALPH